MRPVFLTLFILLPLAEIAGFVVLGGILGLPLTLAVVIGTALLGASVFRFNGVQTWRRAEEAMQRGEPPVAEMFAGVLLFGAAVLLMLPGFITDFAGALLLVPPLRMAVARYAATRFAKSAHVHIHMSGMGRRPPPGAGPVIEGEAEEIGEEGPALPRDDSPWRQ
ncbi:MAG: FxsA family protein [Parvibaculaceae bacterium]|nr:FxsA family protein [Parvibaculaceae bacterium]